MGAHACYSMSVSADMSRCILPTWQFEFNNLKTSGMGTFQLTGIGIETFQHTGIETFQSCQNWN